MLIKEFIDRTGFIPTDDYYHTEIEPEYNRSKLEKDDWCREWKKNGGIQKAYDAMCKDAANNHLRVKELESVIDENTQKLAEYYKRIQELEPKATIYDGMADFLIEQAEKWSATDLRAKAIEMLGSREYLRRKIEKGFNLWESDKELLISVLSNY